MKVLITGSAGFIGSNLAEALLRRGHEVIGIDDFSYGERRNIESLKSNEHFKFIKSDIKTFGVLNNIKCDVLVHLASQKIPRYSSSFKTIVENGLMTDAVINKCLRDGCRLLFASTSDVYGKNPDIPYSEESNLVLGPTDVKRWAYATSKIFSEHKILAYHEEKNLNYTIVRFFGSYGKNQNLTWWGGPQSVFIDKAIKKQEIELHGDGQQTRTFTYIDDTIQGLVLSIEKEEAIQQVFNIASEPKQEVTIEKLAIIIWKLVNGKDSVPKLKLIPYSTFGKYEDVMRRVPDINKIKKVLGFKPKYDLEIGMKKTIEWQKSLINEQD